MLYIFLPCFWSNEQKHYFYKLIKSGLHVRVINTLRNLYTKTYFRVKQGGYLSDLIMTSTTTADAQNQLNGLSNYCSKHRSIVNSVKTKFMVYGRLDNVCLYFNGQALEQVTEYKYLGNIVRSVELTPNDVFAENYEYLCNKARRSIFSIFKKTKNFGSLPPKIRIYLFDSLVRPVLIYGCAIWGTRANGRE